MTRPTALRALSALLLLAPLAAAQLGEAANHQQPTPQELFERRITPEVQVVAAATPAVVFIQTDTKTRVRDFWGRSFARDGKSSGSGVVLSSSGFIVTNYHVIKDATNIRVSFEKSIDDRIYEADLLSYVAEEDLALLKIRDADKEFATLPLGTSSDLMTGERVIAIGNPYGITHTVSVGIISGLHRDVNIGDAGGLKLHFDDLIQTDASINPGNSGGPLLNMNGQLIGINNAVNQTAENIGFAIPIDRVREVLQQQLISPDRYNAWLGFEVSDDDELRVEGLYPGSPAALAGLEDGDRVIGLGEQTLGDLDAYRLARIALRPGEVTNLKVRRGEKTLSLPIQAWDKSDGLIYERLGVRVEAAVVGRRGRTLQLESVRADGAAGLIGLQAGDMINALRPRLGGLSQAYTFADRIDLAQFLDRLAADSELEIEIRRAGQLYQGTLVLH